jgi:hypothetical protein
MPYRRPAERSTCAACFAIPWTPQETVMTAAAPPVCIKSSQPCDAATPKVARDNGHPKQNRCRSPHEAPNKGRRGGGAEEVAPTTKNKKNKNKILVLSEITSRLLLPSGAPWFARRASCL